METIHIDLFSFIHWTHGQTTPFPPMFSLVTLMMAVVMINGIILVKNRRERQEDFHCKFPESANPINSRTLMAKF